MLAKLGLEFEVMAADIEELPKAGEPPEEFVQRAALDKAATISFQYPDAWILGADTIVVYQNVILGKPKDADEAFNILMHLSGQMHEVLTGFCLMREEENISVSRVIATEVYFSAFSKAIAAAYVATGEPLDKAGAYGIQERGGVLVEKINGSYSNVVGLPLAETIEQMLHFGVIEPKK
jgi:septum formation protein